MFPLSTPISTQSPINPTIRTYEIAALSAHQPSAVIMPGSIPFNKQMVHSTAAQPLKPSLPPDPATQKPIQHPPTAQLHLQDQSLEQQIQQQSLLPPTISPTYIIYHTRRSTTRIRLRIPSTLSYTNWHTQLPAPRSQHRQHCSRAHADKRARFWHQSSAPTPNPLC